MTYPATLPWRLVAWVVGGMVIVSAVTFIVVYEQTGSQLRGQVNQDINGDVSQRVRALRSPLDGAQLELHLPGFRSALRPRPYDARVAAASRATR